MFKTLLLISIIMLLAITAGQEMYKARRLEKALKHLEETKAAILDRKGKEIIHDELGDFTSSKENNGDVLYDPTSINKLYNEDK